MSRLIASVTALLLACFGILQLDAAAAATNIPAAAHTYVYDGAVSSGAGTNAERGPTAEDVRGDAYDADGLWPIGGSAHPGDAATSTLHETTTVITSYRLHAVPRLLRGAWAVGRSLPSSCRLTLPQTPHRISLPVRMA